MFELKYLINHFFQLISPAQTATPESFPLDYSAHFVDSRILFLRKTILHEMWKEEDKDSFMKF